jgi:hypothetical protein
MMNEENWLTTFPENLANEMVNDILDNPQVSTTDEISGGLGRFGYDKTNPIPIFGIPNNKVYLNHLRLKNGEKILWKRVGSTIVKKIELPVDVYEIFTLGKKKITTLYLSPYHLRTSMKAPEEFIIVE